MGKSITGKFLESNIAEGENHKVFMAAIIAFHTGKAVVQVPAVSILINDLLPIGPPEVYPVS